MPEMSSAARRPSRGSRNLLTSPSIQKVYRHLAIDSVTADPPDTVDTLANNASTSRVAPIEKFPEHSWDKVMDLNLKSSFL